MLDMPSFVLGCFTGALIIEVVWIIVLLRRIKGQIEQIEKVLGGEKRG